tara:strand:- start:395 stop:694 length:300 start_codon:yes stop_codon:yes gene_type:complete
MNNRISRTDPKFEETLDMLCKRYFNMAGAPDCETIVTRNKFEVKEDGVVCFYSTNSDLCNAIKRCRKGIKSVEVLPEGACLYFDNKAVRQLWTVLKVMN